MLKSCSGGLSFIVVLTRKCPQITGKFDPRVIFTFAFFCGSFSTFLLSFTKAKCATSVSRSSVQQAANPKTLKKKPENLCRREMILHFLRIMTDTQNGIYWDIVLQAKTTRRSFCS